MITLKLPFENLDTCEIIDAVLEGDPVVSMQIDDNIRDKYWSLIDLHKKCTSRHAQDRPSWKNIISILTSVVKGESSNRRPTLTSQKSRMSLTAQLSLYDIQGSADNTFESIEELEQPKIVKNGSVRFRGPQILHHQADTTEDPSESTEAEIPFSVFTKLNQVAKEKKNEILQSSQTSKEEDRDSVKHSSAPSHKAEELLRDSVPLETLATSPGPRRFTRKIILEIKDNSGNVIREEIVDSDEDDESERSERIAQLDEMASNSPVLTTSQPNIREKKERKKKKSRTRRSSVGDKDKMVTDSPRQKSKSPRQKSKSPRHKSKSPRHKSKSPRDMEASKSPRKSPTRTTTPNEAAVSTTNNDQESASERSQEEP